MSKFTTPAILEMLEHYKWWVYEPFEFYLSDDNSDVIEVPAGFVTDLASVPRIFWTLLHSTLLRCHKTILFLLYGYTETGSDIWSMNT